MSKILSEKWNRLAFAKDSTTVILSETKQDESKKEELEEVDENPFLAKIAHAAVDGEEKVIIGDKEYDVDMDDKTAEEITGEKIKEAVRKIMKEFAIPEYDEEETLPIPNVSYPIEIEKIESEAPEMLGLPVEEPKIEDLELVAEPLELMPMLDPAVSIDIAPDAVEPVLDTFEELIYDEEDMYPYDHLDDDGRMMDYGHSKSDSQEGRMTKAKLHRMGRMAQSFHDRLEDGDDLPGWVQDKVTTAEDRLRSAFEYIEYKIHRLEKSGCLCTEAHVIKFAKEYLRS